MARSALGILGDQSWQRDRDAAAAKEIDCWLAIVREERLDGVGLGDALRAVRANGNEAPGFLWMLASQAAEDPAAYPHDRLVAILSDMSSRLRDGTLTLGAW